MIAEHFTTPLQGGGKKVPTWKSSGLQPDIDSAPKDALDRPPLTVLSTAPSLRSDHRCANV